MHFASETSDGDDGDAKSTSLAKIIVCSDLHVVKHYDYVPAYDRILIENLVTAAAVSEFDVCLSVHRCLCVEKKNQQVATECFIALIYAQHVSGTSVPIIRRSRLYVCYYCLWCAMLCCWLLGGQVQGIRLCVQEE